MLHPVMAVDWASMFVPTVSLVELFLRGTAVYLGIFVVMRLFRRQKGSLNAADFLVVVLIADAAQNALAADYHSLTEGAVVVGTIFLWDYILDGLSYLSNPLNEIINGRPILLVKDGQISRVHCRRLMLTKEDVIEQLREQGVGNLAQVKRCYLETDGHFSVIREEEDASVRPTSFAQGVA